MFVASLAAGGCVQAAPLGHELGGDAGTTESPPTGTTTDDASTGGSTSQSESDTSPTEDDDGGTTSLPLDTGDSQDNVELPLPTDWAPPEGCGTTAAAGLGCLPAATADCNTGAGYADAWWRAKEIDEERLWVAGIYQSRGDHSGSFHPTGSATVDWAVAGSNTLVLSAYEPTVWTVRLLGSGALDRIVVTGFHNQAVEAPAGIEVETYTYDTGAQHVACGYSVPGDGGGCEGEELARFAQNVTGLRITGFDGCYDATSFSFGW